MIIEISTHGSTLKRNHDSFVIQNGETKSEFPAEKIDSILISANSLVSSEAIRLAIEKQIHMVFTSWNGSPYARIWTPSQGKSSKLRRWQYLNQDSPTGIEISKDIITRKIKNQKKFLIELKNNRNKTNTVLENTITSLNENLENIELQKVKEKLLGYEGLCAKIYFAAISSILPTKWRFSERSQHPALDGFNSALNYIYGIGYSDVEKIIILSGLEPNAGFLHADSYGKPTLSFDLIEIIRPSLDKIIVGLFTKRKARQDWFEENMGGVFLTKEGRIQIISNYAEMKKEIEKSIWQYCQKIIGKIGRAHV